MSQPHIESWIALLYITGIIAVIDIMQKHRPQSNVVWTYYTIETLEQANIGVR